MSDFVTRSEALSVSRKGLKQKAVFKGSSDESLSYSLSAGGITERGERGFLLGETG